jgi:hypothetical protein
VRFSCFTALLDFRWVTARSWGWLLVVLLLPLASGHAKETSDIYRTKAGYLFNFLRFTDWPEGTLPGQTPLHVAVGTDSATFQLISEALFGKVVNGHPIAVEHPGEILDGSPPQLLFVTRSASAEDRALVAWYRQSPVLTIGEADGFARQDGIINFVIVNESVRFEVNLAAAQRAGLRISSRLSKLAILIRPAP